MSEWAPLVHGRTLRVDFRDNLIVVPSDFGQEEIAWARRYILGTTVSPEGLRQGPRWSLFNDGRRCVVGVSCMASLVSDDMNADEFGRPLYVFLGYVTQAPAPRILPMSLEPFRPLYQFVRNRWEEGASEAGRVVRHDYDAEFDGLLLPPAEVRWGFNHDSQFVFLDPVEQSELIWSAASAYQRPLSLCLGLAHSKDAEEGYFLNTTAADVPKPLRARRRPPQTAPAHKPPPAQAPHRQKEDWRARREPPRRDEPSVFGSVINGGAELLKDIKGIFSPRGDRPSSARGGQPGYGRPQPYDPYARGGGAQKSRGRDVPPPEQTPPAGFKFGAAPAQGSNAPRPDDDKDSDS